MKNKYWFVILLISIKKDFYHVSCPSPIKEVKMSIAHQMFEPACMKLEKEDGRKLFHS